MSPEQQSVEELEFRQVVNILNQVADQQKFIQDELENHGNRVKLHVHGSRGRAEYVARVLRSSVIGDQYVVDVLSGLEENTMVVRVMTEGAKKVNEKIVDNINHYAQEFF